MDGGEGSGVKPSLHSLPSSFRDYKAPQRNQDLQEQGLEKMGYVVVLFYNSVSFSQKGCLFLSRVKIIYVGGAGDKPGFCAC